MPIAEGAIGVEMFNQMQTTSPLAMIIIFALLLIFFRKLELIFLPMLIATASIISTMGLMVGLGFPVHILSSMLPIFLMSISMVDSIHVLSEFFDIYSKDKGKKKSIQQAMETLFIPILYTSLTTAAGFFSLTFAPIPPAQVFGCFLSIGVMLAWLYTILFIPAYIMIIPEKKFKNFGLLTAEKNKKSFLSKFLIVLKNISYRNAKVVLVIFLIISIIAVFGIGNITINDNYSKRFCMDHPIRKADIALNQHFGGTYTAYLIFEINEVTNFTIEEINKMTFEFRVFSKSITKEFKNADKLAQKVFQKLPDIKARSNNFEEFLEKIIKYIDDVSLKAADKNYYAWQELQSFFSMKKEKLKIFKHPKMLNYMAKLQNNIEKSNLVGKTTSISDVVRKVNQELIDGKEQNFCIPKKIQGVSECYMQFQQSHKPHDLWHLVSPDYKKANIWVQFKSGDSKNTERIVKYVDEYIKKFPPPFKIQHNWAGLHYINLVFQNKMFWGMLKSLSGSFIIVFCMMAFLFRSLKWGLLCMVPLTITIGLIYGAIGLIGKDYDMPIAVLGTLSLGIAVDFAIHFYNAAGASIWKEIPGKQQFLKFLENQPELLLEI